MASPLFVSFDGPKGTGKTTLIRSVSELLQPYVTLRCLVEKDLDPFATESRRLLSAAGPRPTQEVEAEVVEKFARGRAWITEHVLRLATEHVVLMDRWFPSDAAFRRHVPFAESLEANQRAGVAIPDLVIATTCDPRESWLRAHARHRGLDSVVIHDEVSHAEATRRFEAAAQTHRWALIRTEEPAEVIAGHVYRLIAEHLPL
ncbi:thymidylate kinase [Pyxidicoccus caerfyrddinensis]|uniref:thymidylate kinase n=1 Tax=Pyxidicoccus caerfyrddinensis TaxID=2709663 RepID=UPI0013DC424B|nr:thymidylate kinase [Pyxidicoccus caerfyrddinensis]